MRASFVDRLVSHGRNKPARAMLRFYLCRKEDPFRML